MKLKFSLTDRTCGTNKKFTDSLELQNEKEYVIKSNGILIEISEVDSNHSDVFFADDIDKITIERQA